MFRRVSALWKRLRALQPGKRFQTFYRQHRGKPLAVKATFIAIAIACFAAGAVFAFIPGPAILFFAAGGALLAAQSLSIARALDASEVWARKKLASIRTRSQRDR